MLTNLMNNLKRRSVRAWRGFREWLNKPSPVTAHLHQMTRLEFVVRCNGAQFLAGLTGCLLMVGWVLPAMIAALGSTSMLHAMTRKLIGKENL